MTQATFDFTGEQLKRAGMALAQEHADAVTPNYRDWETDRKSVV